MTRDSLTERRFRSSIAPQHGTRLGTLSGTYLEDHSAVSGGPLRGLVAALAVAVLALPFAREGANSAVTALALLLTGLGFSSLGVITGIWADTFDQHALIANIVITPLALVGGLLFGAMGRTRRCRRDRRSDVSHRDDRDRSRLAPQALSRSTRRCSLRDAIRGGA